MKWKTLLRFPDAAEGASAAGAPTLTGAPAADPNAAPITPDNANTQTETVDWDKAAGQEFTPEVFRGQAPVPPEPKPAEQEKGKDDDTGEVREEGEEKGEVQEVQKEEAPEGGKPNGEEGEPELNEDKSNTQTPEGQQQQEETNPVYKAFPEFKPLVKKMSREAAVYVTARLNDLVQQQAEIKEAHEALALAQQGKTKIPESYYENPNAVVLLPEFQQASSNVSLATKISDHWRDQYTRILNGEEWQELEAVADAQGRMIDVRPKAAKLPANGTAQASVEDYLYNSRQQVARYVQQQEQLVAQFNQNVQARMTKIKQAEDQFFPPDRFEKKGSPEYVLVENVKAGLKNIGITEANPAFNMLAKTGAVVLQLREYITHAEKSKGKVARIEQKAAKAGPAGSAAGTSGAESKAEPEDVMGAFNKVLINRT